VELKMAALIAVVYCNARYTSCWNSATPSSPNRPSSFQCRRSRGSMGGTRGTTKGVSTARAVHQRQKLSAVGVMSARRARASSQLPAQNSMDSDMRR